MNVMLSFFALKWYKTDEHGLAIMVKVQMGIINCGLTMRTTKQKVSYLCSHYNFWPHQFLIAYESAHKLCTTFPIYEFQTLKSLSLITTHRSLMWML